MAGSVILAIDPGLRGGLCFMSDDGIIAEPMPLNQEGDDLDLHEIAKMLGDWKHDLRFVLVEEMRAIPVFGNFQIVGVRKLWRGIGSIHGICVALNIEIKFVAPHVWMKVMHEGQPGGKKGKETKIKSRAAFEALFPGVNVTKPGCRVPDEGMIEATLIAEYGRRMNL